MHSYTKPILTALAFAALGWATSYAELTYVDATSGASGNTALANGSTFFPAPNGVTRSDNNWEARPFAANGNIFEAGGETSENAPELKTTITGLIPGSEYSVYVNFWDADGQNWNVRASFTSSANTLFSDANSASDLRATTASLASTLDYVNAPIFTEDDRTMYAGLIGTTTADDSGEISVFIDDWATTDSGVYNARTWYDGVSYEDIPEPGAYALLLGGVATLCIAIRRRSRRSGDATLP